MCVSACINEYVIKKETKREGKSGANFRDPDFLDGLSTRRQSSFRRTHNELCARLPFSPFRHHCGKFQYSAKDSSSPTHTHTHTPTSRQIDKVAIFIFTYWENEPKKRNEKEGIQREAKSFRRAWDIGANDGSRGHRKTTNYQLCADQILCNVRFCLCAGAEKNSPFPEMRKKKESWMKIW